MLKDFLFFLKVGSISFGKMVATSHMMEEFVSQRKILSQEEFISINGFCKLLPGPSQTQTSIVLGYLQGGVLRGIAGGIAYLLPSWVLITLAAYFTFDMTHLVPLDRIMYGLNILALAFLVEASWKLAQKSIKSRSSCIILLGSVLLSFFGVDIIVLLFLAILIQVITYSKKLKNPKIFHSILPLWLFSPTLWEMFFFFLKIGAFIYGGGLVMIPFIQEEIVIQRAWLTEEEFLMGFAVGSATPGPVILTVAFFGYKVALSLGYSGLLGSFIASLGVMLPAFVLILSLAKIILASPKIPWLSHILQGVMPATLGAVVVTAFTLGKSILQSPLEGGFFVLSLVLLLVFKLNPIWLLLGFSGIGFVVGGL